MNISWKKFIETKRENPEPQPLLVEALPYVSHRGTALDIGAGPLLDTEYLLENGFKSVIVVDPEIETGKLIRRIADERIEYLARGIESYTFEKESLDLVNAQFVFPYLSKEDIETTATNIYDALSIGGIFTGQFFGEKDSWNTPEDYRTYLSESEIAAILSPFEILILREEEKDTTSRLGKSKHSHLFEYIVQKNKLAF